MTTKIKAGVIGDGVVGTTQIAANAVTSAKLAQNSVLTKHIDDNQIGIDQLNVSDGSDGQFLKTNGSGTLSFATVSGTTINNNADNRIITGSGTANTLNGEANLTFDSSLVITKSEGAANSLNDQISLEHTNGTTGYHIKTIRASANDNPDGIAFVENTTERMRIRSGNVGIGITNPAHTLSVYKAGDGQTPVRFNTGNNEPLDFYNDSETWKIHAAQGIGFMAKGTGLITFYTTDSETECARWTNNRAFKTKQGTSAYANATSNYNEICSNADATANLLIRQGSTYYADVVNLWYYAATGPNNTHSNFLNAFDQQGTRAKIFSNGGFANYQSNNSNLCDEREKKNITTASNTWNDVKSWNIKTFHYNEDDDSDAKRYGVIAQDIETTNPDLIVDWEKNKERAQELWQEEDKPLPEGVNVGDEKSPAQAQVMRKAVKEQQMYMMAIKALQEAMTEIDSLKARITTLEG